MWKDNYNPLAGGIFISGIEDVTPHIVENGSNGAIVAWKEFRNKDTSSDIYAQHIDNNGNKKWMTGGMSISTSSFREEDPQIISDSSGGAIITWYNGLPRTIGGFGKVYAQRIDGAGEIKWSKNGIIVCKAKEPLTISKFQQYNPVIVSDSLGGAIIAWSDMRNGNHSDIYAQRIDENGEIIWKDDGVPICVIEGDQLIRNIVSDGAGGAIITWVDKQRNGIYTQRIDKTGKTVWKDNGVDIFSMIQPSRVGQRDALLRDAFFNYRNNSSGGVSIMLREKEYVGGLYRHKFYLENIPLN